MRENWKSQMGFVLASVGSAVGLANIWRFPYIVGQNGGASFVFAYIVCLIGISIPVFLSEIALGRHAKKDPYGTFSLIGKTRLWKFLGGMSVATAFCISAFYSAVAGWVVGYMIEAFKGNLSHFENVAQSQDFYHSLMGNPSWGISMHALFMLLACTLVYKGVKEGIEKGTRWLMPLLFFILVFLFINGLTLPKASEGISFLFFSNVSQLSSTAWLTALGHAFFTLSLGQGTMITYGSYMSKKDSIIGSCLPIVLADTLVSLMAAVIVFTALFSIGHEPSSGPGLVFETMPMVFSSMSGGHVIAILFFTLVFLAAVTSQISVLEPVVSFFIDEKQWSRKKAVTIIGICSFLVGLPCALSTSFGQTLSLFGKTPLGLYECLTQNLLVPLGGFVVLILAGRVWGVASLIKELKTGAENLFVQYSFLELYIRFAVKFLAPVLVLFVLLGLMFDLV